MHCFNVSMIVSGRKRPTQALAYNALSYEWGDPQQPRHWMRLNNGYVSIRQNLFDFLKTARSKLQSEPNLGKHLWIDALCIDQENVEEKGHQIGLMGELYRRASTVYVWLGSASSADIDASADWIHKLEREAEYTFGTSVQPNYCSYDYGPCSSVSPLLGSYAVEEICSRSYWDRMWISQELCLAKHARLMVGKHVFSWWLIHHALLHVQLQRPKVRWRYEKLASTTPARLVEAFYEGTKSKDAYILEDSICQVVARFVQGKCSVIHDKVHAVIVCRLTAPSPLSTCSGRLSWQTTNARCGTGATLGHSRGPIVFQSTSRGW